MMHWTIGQDFGRQFSEEAAKAEVEKAGEGHIIKWVNDGGHWRSCAMQAFRAGAWVGVNIHG